MRPVGWSGLQEDIPQKKSKARSQDAEQPPQATKRSRYDMLLLFSSHITHICLSICVSLYVHDDGCIHDCIALC